MIATRVIATGGLLAGLAFAAPAAARADTWVYGPWYGPNGGRAGAVVHINPWNGNTRLTWGAQAPNGRWLGGRAAVYHGLCGTAWSRVHRGPNGVVVRRGAVGNGACW